MRETQSMAFFKTPGIDQLYSGDTNSTPSASRIALARSLTGPGKPALSWMSVVVGDPLYRPYASWLQLDASRDSIRADNWRAYHEFAAKYYPNSSKQYRSLARQTAARARNCPMLEDLGLMEAHEGNFPAATSYFSQARACYSARDDILRVVLEEAEGWARQNKPKRALDLVRSVLRIAGDATAAPMLRQIEHDLSTQPAAQKR